MDDRSKRLLAEIAVLRMWRCGPKRGEALQPSVLAACAEALLAGDGDKLARIIARAAGCEDAPPPVPGDPDYYNWEESKC